MESSVFWIVSCLLMGVWVLAYDSEIASAVTQFAVEVFEFKRKQGIRIWGDFANPPDPRLTYMNFLSFLRLVGAVFILNGAILIPQLF